MKKFKFLAMIIGALTASSVSFASASGAMEVTATVLETLTVRVDQNASFGNIAKGSTGNKATGLYSVKGEGGNTATITIDLPEDGRVALEHESGATLYATADHLEHRLNLIQDSFVASRPINFTLDIPGNAVGGTYRGNVLVKAKYD
ncbi:MAG: hypothetical protein ACRCXX_14500 [Cetobacterium sp.]|uniref:hypothetical protein n=1 Tax=Cetobacterium sp. TaxID=2071632 RepID=UPI003F2E00E6